VVVFLNTPALPDYTSTQSAAGGAAAAVMCRLLSNRQSSFHANQWTAIRGTDAILLRFLIGRHGEW
jgi:hypothetical protein